MGVVRIDPPDIMDPSIPPFKVTQVVGTDPVQSATIDFLLVIHMDMSRTVPK